MRCVCHPELRRSGEGSETSQGKGKGFTGMWKTKCLVNKMLGGPHRHNGTYWEFHRHIYHISCISIASYGDNSPGAVPSSKSFYALGRGKVKVSESSGPCFQLWQSTCRNGTCGTACPWPPHISNERWPSFAGALWLDRQFSPSILPL